MPKGIYERKIGVRKLSEETKKRIGLKNSNNMREYWKKQKPTTKQLEALSKGREETNRCKKCGTMKGKNKEHDCEKIFIKMSNSHKGKKHTEERKEKIGKSNKGKHKKGEERNKEIVEKIRKKLKKYFSNEENKILASCYAQKINREDWNGFKKTEYEKIRRSKEWKKWRKKVFERDKFTCKNKNCKYCNNELGVEIHPHHIKPFSIYPNLVFEIDNGRTLCANYHLKSNLHKNLKKGAK